MSPVNWFKRLLGQEATTARRGPLPGPAGGQGRSAGSGPARRRVVSWSLAVEPYWEALPGSRTLLQAIAEEPWDEGLRLMLADWLYDQGEEARAEFIRVQVRRYNLPPGDRERAGLEARARQLLEENGKHWLAGLPEVEGVHWAGEGNFPGGLLERLRVGWGALQREGERLFTLADLRGLRVSDVAESEVAALAGQPWLAHLASLSLGYNWISAEGAAALASSPALANLAALDLGHNRLGAEGAAALASSPHLANLASLSLWDNDIGAQGAAALASSPHLANLVSLNLSDNRIGAQGTAALARSPHLGNLTSLDLSSNRIGARGVAALARSPYLANLASLDLSANGFRPQGEATKQLLLRWPFVRL
jgi:uncharacterized protein (TIGR02996 family)